MITFICFSLVFINNAYAVQTQISIKSEPSYKLIKDIIKNNISIGKIYEINVTLVNSGLGISDELTVNLTDEENFTLSKKIIINPGETKIISFTWSTLLIKNQQIIISFYPSDQDIIWNQYNSGSQAFTIYMTDENNVQATSTPGFEIVLVIASILIFSFPLKKNKS